MLDPAGGPPLGAAVAIAPPSLVLTSAHVACAALVTGVPPVRLQRGDGATEANAAILAVSDRFDLAVLGAPEGFLREPAPTAGRMPQMGDPVWAVGPPQLGRAIAAGPVLSPAILVPGMGEGFMARIPALMGYSGGPVVDAEGHLVGLVTAALQEPLAAELVALLTGLDLAGLAFGRGRRVFVLDIAAAQREAHHLLDGASLRPSLPAAQTACAKGYP